MDARVYELASKEYMTKMYVEEKMGLSAIQKKFKEQFGMDVSVGFLSNRLNEFGIYRRTSSEARRIVANSLDWDKTFLTEPIIEAIDGFLIGDGSASVSHNKQIARMGCGVQHKEFAEYMKSFFLVYDPSELKFYPDKQERSSGTWDFRTKYHPDLYKRASLWYPANEPRKVVPVDVRITPISVMLWYLGDGTVIQSNNTCVVRLSTDAFKKDDIEQILIPKLRNVGVNTVRTSENRIRVETRSVPQFFDFIGRTSPITCYSYKFNLPEWRFEAIRMSEAAKILNVDYGRLSYMVKIGRQPCYRIKEKGRPRFLPEHLEVSKSLILSGELF